MKNVKPLEGIVVVDFTRALSGPYCAQILGDLGAEIIKIENPAHGDDSRLFAPKKDGKSLYFSMINGGKKSIAMNLKNPKSIELLKKILPQADVVLENFKPGVMAKFGLDYESVKEINPRAIYASISGFGQTGPDAVKPSYDILAQARGGLMSLTGYPDGDPMMVGVSFGDTLAGIYAVAGITAALYEREKTGCGQRIDVSMLDCQISVLESSMMRYQATKIAPKPVGCRHPTEAPFQAFKTADRPFVIAAVAGEEMFQRLCEVIGHPEIGRDPRFADAEARHENPDALGAELQKIFVNKTAAEWIDLLEKNAIPVSLIQDLAEVCADPQIQARHMLVDAEGLDGIKMVGNPIKMSSLPEMTSRAAAPDVGQDTVAVLKRFGFSDAEIQDFVS